MYAPELRIQFWLIFAACAALFLLGVWVGFVLFHAEPPQPARDTVRGAVVQADGSVLATRVPVPKPPPVPHVLPQGGKEERRLRIVTKPITNPDTGCDCGPVTVDVSLVREADNTSGVVVSSPAGIDAAHTIDTPILQPPAPLPPRSATAFASPDGGAYGALIGQRFTVGGVPLEAHVGAVIADGRAHALLGATVRF